MDVKNKIDKFINKNNVPNLLFYGPNYNIKKEVCDYFIDKIYKTEEYKQKYVLYINRVSIKGIKMVKENIKLFSMQIIKKQEDINFKTIILDFCESLTYDSQYSLRRTIEQFSHNTRFLFLCDNMHNLLSPILSRFIHIYVDNNLEQNIYSLEKKNNLKLNKFMNIYKEIIKTDDYSLNDIYQLAENIYNSNIFSMEVFNKFKNHKNYNTVNMIFKKITQNISNEVLCIFYILNIFRNNCDFEIYDLY